MLLVVIRLVLRALKLRKLVTNNWSHVSPLFRGVGGVSGTTNIAEFFQPFYGLY